MDRRKFINDTLLGTLATTLGIKASDYKQQPVIVDEDRYEELVDKLIELMVLSMEWEAYNVVIFGLVDKEDHPWSNSKLINPHTKEIEEIFNEFFNKKIGEVSN